MSPVLSLDDVALSDAGPALSLTLASRHSLCVLGPAASGKTRFLRVCAGLEKPARGTVKRIGKAAFAGSSGFGRRATPQTVAQESAAKGSHHPAEALTALGLWDVRKQNLSELSSGQALACELAGPLSSSADILLIDGQLDGLDPWAYRDAMTLLQKRVGRGAILVVATNRPEWAALTDQVVVLKGLRVVFAGTYEDLERQGAPSELELETKGQEGVRALTEPFEVQVAQANGKTVLRASEGQELAAKLLLEGYGDVKAVVVRQPGPRELVEGLLR